MTHSQSSTLVTEAAFPGDWLEEEDRESVRHRHAASVERWLDAASFANELFKLHAKYGIEQGDEGYAAYRLYLQQQYEKVLLTNGPMVDPLGEGCDCLFCRFDHESITFRRAKPATEAAVNPPEPESSVVNESPVDLPHGDGERRDECVGELGTRDVVSTGRCRHGAALGPACGNGTGRSVEWQDRRVHHYEQEAVSRKRTRRRPMSMTSRSQHVVPDCSDAARDRYVTTMDTADGVSARRCQLGAALDPACGNCNRRSVGRTVSSRGRGPPECCCDWSGFRNSGCNQEEFCLVARQNIDRAIRAVDTVRSS